MAEHTPTDAEMRQEFGFHLHRRWKVDGEGLTTAEALAEYDRWLAAHDRAVKAEALRDLAHVLDHEAAEERAGRRVADVRCDSCDIRYAERDEYSCGEPGHGHRYSQYELSEAAVVTVTATYDGDRLRARADKIEGGAQ